MADASFFHNIKHLVIRDGKFIFNLQQIQVVEFAFSSGHNEAIIPQGAGSQALYLLLAKVRHLIGVLPTAHLELACHCVGWGRQYTTSEIRNSIISVAIPLFTSSLFSVLPATVRFMALYILVSMVVLDLLHPMRLERTRLRAFVKVLDALGKYHDFPWAACKNLTTFHAEFVKRCRNQAGFLFIKSRWYELEYNGRIMQQEDWKAVEPFTDISVDFFLIQEDETMVMCPWCKHESSRPSSYEESADVMCSCASCDRDFVVMGSLQAEPDDSVVATDRRSNGDNNVDPKILRLRVKMQPSGRNAVSTPLPDELHAVVENRSEGSTSLVVTDENCSQLDPPPRSMPTIGEPVGSIRMLHPQSMVNSSSAGTVIMNVKVEATNDLHGESFRKKDRFGLSYSTSSGPSSHGPITPPNVALPLPYPPQYPPPYPPIPVPKVPSSSRRTARITPHRYLTFDAIHWNLHDHHSTSVHHRITPPNVALPYFQYAPPYPPIPVPSVCDRRHLSSRALLEPASEPPLPFIHISSQHLPWSCKVHASNGRYITVSDVLESLYRSFRINITMQEFQSFLSDKDKRRATRAYEERYRRLHGRSYEEEKRGGMKRVDFLMGRTRFGGLSADDHQPQQWHLRVT